MRVTFCRHDRLVMRPGSEGVSRRRLRDIRVRPRSGYRRPDSRLGAVIRRKALLGAELALRLALRT